MGVEVDGEFARGRGLEKPENLVDAWGKCEPGEGTRERVGPRGGSHAGFP